MLQHLLFASQTIKQPICCLLCLATLVSCQLDSTRLQSNTRTTPSPRSPVVLPNQSTPIASPKDTIAQAPRPHPAFRSIFPALQYQTEIPIVLPSYIPGDDSAEPLYALLENATASHYQIMLAFTANCTGGNACRLGSVSGQAASEAPLTGQPVALRDEITGYFVAATCGATCSDATVTWEQDGYRYTVGIKAGTEADLVDIANSAIANGTF